MVLAPVIDEAELNCISSYGENETMSSILCAKLVALIVNCVSESTVVICTSSVCSFPTAPKIIKSSAENPSVFLTLSVVPAEAIFAVILVVSLIPSGPAKAIIAIYYFPYIANPKGVDPGLENESLIVVENPLCLYILSELESSL